MANRPRTQGHFCKTTGLVSLKTQRPRVGNRTAAQPHRRREDYHSSLRGHTAGRSHGPLPLTFFSLWGRGGMQLCGPWVLDQGLNLGPRRQRVDVQCESLDCLFLRKRMLSGDLLRPAAPSEPESTDKGRAPALQLRAGAGGTLDLLPTYPASRTRTPACSEAPGSGHSSGTSAAGRAASSSGRGSLPTKATSADLVPTESEPHLPGCRAAANIFPEQPPPVQSHHPGLAARGPRSWLSQGVPCGAELRSPGPAPRDVAGTPAPCRAVGPVPRASGSRTRATGLALPTAGCSRVP